MFVTSWNSLPLALWSLYSHRTFCRTFFCTELFTGFRVGIETLLLSTTWRHWGVSMWFWRQM